MAEDLTDYLKELGVKVQYLHSEVDTLERVAILRDLRLGVLTSWSGSICCARIDLPEVTPSPSSTPTRKASCVGPSLIQMSGRARNTAAK
jgi:excinuclease ABC subunit B